MATNGDKNEQPKRPRWAKAFLSSLAITGNVTAAAKAARVHRPLVYELRNADSSFADDWREALEQAAELLEQEARRRAHDGLVRFKFKKDGTPIYDPRPGRETEPYYELEYSDTLLIFLLKGAKPTKYRERQEIMGEGGGPVRYERVEELDDDALGRIAASGRAGTPEPPPGAPGPA